MWIITIIISDKLKARLSNAIIYLEDIKFDILHHSIENNQIDLHINTWNETSLLKLVISAENIVIKKHLCYN